MRGFLKSREGIFQLAANTTTIGQEGCDLFISVCTKYAIHFYVVLTEYVRVLIFTCEKF